MHNNRLLIIGLVWPEPQSSAAGKRMLQLIELFQKWHYDVTFASTALENEINFDLNALGIKKETIELNASSFDDFIKTFDPAIVLFDRFIIEEQFGWRVSENCPSAFKILDSEDLHCLRYTRAAQFKKGIAFNEEDLFSQDWTKREISSILRCDLTLIIAEYEMELLMRQFKISVDLLFYIPLFFDDAELKFERVENNFEDRKDFVFIGNFWHEPNWDAVLYLKKVIWPYIRKQLPKATIRIYGAYPSQKVFDLNNKSEGFLVIGRAEEAKKVIAASRILIAPLRFGAGIKGKLLEAMQYGTPSITTSIGAESINGSLEWNGFISDDPIELASNAVLLYQNQELWNKSQRNGMLILKGRFNKSDFERSFYDKMILKLKNLKEQRNANFYGNLLSHHSMRSTEYMSRWIEEKNKNRF